MKTKRVLDALIEFSSLDKEKCPDKLKATFQDGKREYYVTFNNDRLMFECYGWEGILLCSFVSECFPESWEFIRWRFAFDSFAELTERVLSGAISQDLISAFESKTRELESRLRETTNIIKRHEQKEEKCKDERSMLAFLNDRFAEIDKSFDEIEEILNTHLDRFVGIHECFQGGQMELSNIRDEVSHQLRKLTNKEHDEEE